MMTIALSTNIPIATINAPREMRWRVVPKVNKIGNESAIVNINPKPIITPLRSPILNISTRITIATDSTRFHMKELMASSTLSGWKKTLSVSMPAGTCFITSASLRSTALPTSGTIASASIARQMASAGCPERKKPLRCGSA